MENIEKQLEAASKRPVTTCDFGPELQDGVQFNGALITSIGCVELSPKEELMALQRANKSEVAAAFELAKACLVEVNEKPIDKTNGDDDRLWTALGPRRRALVVLLYGEMHQPEDKTAASFLKSRRVKL